MSNNAERPLEAGVLRRGLLSLGGFLVVLALASVPARWDWLVAGVAFPGSLLSSRWRWPLFTFGAETPRFSSPGARFTQGTKAWDKVVLFFLILSFMAIFPWQG